MTTYKVVVDGSNIATEGRSLPSLTQLDEAVQSFIEEHPGADVLVIVDSSFPNRVDQKELAIFEAAYAAGEIITPPAGTIGRGDSFILKVADKLGATVFSNDSFQEFHGTYDWLFEKGRLVGGKPIPGYGWVFTPRIPVRGPKSREAVRESKRSAARIGSPEASRPMPVPKAPPPFLVKSEASEATPERPAEKSERRKRSGRSRGADAVVPNVELRVDDESERKKKKKKRKRKGGIGISDAPVLDLPTVNEPLAFINFISQHLLGSELDGVVSTYSSHGFYVEAAGARCYVPLSGLATPTPRSAKEVVRKGETYRWVVTAFDSSRRGIELALVDSPAALAFDLDVATAESNGSAGDAVSDSASGTASGEPGSPTEVAGSKARSKSSRSRSASKAKAAPAVEVPGAVKAPKTRVSARAKAGAVESVDAPTPVVVPRKVAAKKAAKAPAAKVAKAPVAKTRVAKASVVKGTSVTPAEAGVSKATAKLVAAPADSAKASLKKAAAKKVAATRAPAAKTATKQVGATKAPTKATATRSATGRPAKAAAAKAPAKASSPKTSPVKKAPAKTSPAKKASAKTSPVKKASAKTSPGKKAPVKTSAEKKAPVKKSTARKPAGT